MKRTAPSVSPMSNEARNSYVIGQITDALLGLLRSKPIEEVSISELCSAAGVGRASFTATLQARRPCSSARTRSCCASGRRTMTPRPGRTPPPAGSPSPTC